MKIQNYRRRLPNEPETVEIETERPGDIVAAITETPREMEIDVANGLRGARGRRPVPADFEGLLTPEGNSGDVVGSAVVDELWDDVSTNP